MVRLNPLIKVESITDKKCQVKLLIDRTSYSINTDLFINFLDIIQNKLKQEISLEDITRELLSRYNVSTNIVEFFVTEMLNKKILIQSIEDYPVKQIDHWIKRNWLNALIYHLESQNIEYLDDGSKVGEDKKSYLFDNKNHENIWKIYKNADTVVLPPSDYGRYSLIPFEEVLLKRNSFSPFKKCPIELQDLSDIFYAVNIDLVSNRKSLESSIKFLYNSSFTELETYIFIFAVKEIESGLYHYNPKEHNLALIKKGSFRSEVEEMCIGQKHMSLGGCLFLLTANTERYMFRYKHERAYRNMLVNVAEFAQRYIFFSTALGYSTSLTPAIKDIYTHQLLELEGFKEIPLYTIGIG